MPPCSPVRLCGACRLAPARSDCQPPAKEVEESPLKGGAGGGGASGSGGEAGRPADSNLSSPASHLPGGQGNAAAAVDAARTHPSTPSEGGGGGGGGSASKPRRKIGQLQYEGDLALHALVGQAVYVNGTGNAREVRKVGVVRRVGDQIRVESEGHLMGLNDFCASASNTKKRPRECVHIVETGLSLAKTMEALGARAAVEQEAAGGDDAGAEGDAADGEDGGSAQKRQRVNGQAGEGGEGSEEEFVEVQASAELMEECATFDAEDAVAAEFDQPKVNFTSVRALCEPETPAETHARLFRETETFKNCTDALRTIMTDRDVALVQADAEGDAPRNLTKVHDMLINNKYTPRPRPRPGLRHRDAKPPAAPPAPPSSTSVQ